MGNIHVLDEHVANLIAAGEVVERPASVIKELIENAIDAGASAIDIIIEEGGLGLIRVTDNGSGIHADDCEKAFYRHATSKISSGKDLFQIRTLGFRGEALPSIASVAKVECVSCDNSSGLGRRLRIEGGKIIDRQDCTANKGTDLSIKELFYNTPARLKYMKTTQTELGHISDYVYHLSLAHPEIAFMLKHHDHTLLRTSGNGDLLGVIAAVYGASTARSMIHLGEQSLDYRISGYVGKPEITRSNRSGQSIFVNGRYIRSLVINHAISKAYHTLLPVHRYPIFVLRVDMDPSIVDVNVHPAKLEVRFSKEKELVHFVENVITHALQSVSLMPSFNQSSNVRKFVSSERTDQSVQPKAVQEEMPLYRTNMEQAAAAESAKGRKSGNSYSPIDSNSIASNPIVGNHVANEIMNLPSKDIPSITFPSLSPIGQLHGTYIVAQNNKGLFLIDQHAAHERIHYEYYYDQFGKPHHVSQELLVPITLEYKPAEAAFLASKLPLFEQAGVYLEPFGGNTFIVRAYPHWFPVGSERDIMDEMAAWILSENAQINIAKLREKAAILCSCKASIKANHHQSLLEMESLLDRLSQCSNPYTCPHGRPIMISFSNLELEKMFKRVM